MTAEYFSREEVGTPTAAGFYVDLDGSPAFPLTEGILVRSVLGYDAMVNLVEIAGGGVAPEHAHSEEQIVIVLEGAVRFNLGGDERIMRAGEAAIIPSWIRHGAVGEAERSRTVEVFSPPRAALLHLMGRNLLDKG